MRPDNEYEPRIQARSENLPHAAWFHGISILVRDFAEEIRCNDRIIALLGLASYHQPFRKAVQIRRTCIERSVYRRPVLQEQLFTPTEHSIDIKYHARPVCSYRILGGGG